MAAVAAAAVVAATVWDAEAAARESVDSSSERLEAEAEAAAWAAAAAAAHSMARVRCGASRRRACSEPVVNQLRRGEEWDLG